MEEKDPQETPNTNENNPSSPSENTSSKAKENASPKAETESAPSSEDTDSVAETPPAAPSAEPEPPIIPEDPHIDTSPIAELAEKLRLGKVLSSIFGQQVLVQVQLLEASEVTGLS